jgi:beta-lactamase superfamily II metal-dependent hydrolase
MFTIHMLPAAHGDCLLIEYGSKSHVHRLLIDGGVAPTYNTLRERLLAIPDEERLFELLVVSHVDADHIEGIVKMLTDKTLDFRVHDVWFNGWQHLTEGQPADFGGVQGEYLGAMIQKRKLLWNHARGGGAIYVPDEGPLPVFELRGGLKLTLLSPTLETMWRMADAWEKEVQKAGLDPNHPKEALKLMQTKGKKLIAHFSDEGPDIEELAADAFKGDSAPANGSSIAFLAEHEGKSVIFAADAYGDVLAASIDRLLEERGLEVLEVDAFKLPHHGSKANVSPSVLERVSARHMLVSTSGAQFEHPDPEAIARVIQRGGQPHFTFNYRSEENEIWDHAGLKKKHGYTTRYPKTNDEGISIELG